MLWWKKWKYNVNRYRNNHFLCDIFGRKKIRFLPKISGIANVLERKNYPLTSRNTNSQKLLTEVFSSKDKISKQNKYIDYFPTTRKFEGYTNFPRPIVPPYSNISSHKQIKKNEIKINNCFNFYF